MTATAARSYRIASGDTLINLEKAVNQALLAGWQPYGPPFITHDHRVVQALILPAGVEPAPGAMPLPTGSSAISAAPQHPQTPPQQPQPQAPAAQPQAQPAAAQPQAAAAPVAWGAQPTAPQGG